MLVTLAALQVCLLDIRSLINSEIIFPSDTALQKIITDYFLENLTIEKAISLKLDSSRKLI